MSRTLIAAFLGLCVASNALATDGEAAFNRLKSLAGTWKTSMNKVATTVVYRVTSGGNAIEERIDVGTPHEMITMYYLDSGNLALTHYCAVGNQPQMKCVSSDGDTLKFDFAGGTNIKQGTGHMHSMTLHFIDANSFHESWHYFQNGKETFAAEFDLHRAPQTR